MSITPEIASANKLLHYYDINYFNQRGLKFYDFGGWDDIESLLFFNTSFAAKPIKVFVTTQVLVKMIVLSKC